MKLSFYFFVPMRGLSALVFLAHFVSNQINGQAEIVVGQVLHVPVNGTTGFDSVDPTSSGITFTNTLQELTGAANRVLFNGAGVAVGDVDGDSLPDLFFCGLESENQLYRNLGQWRFQRMPLPDAAALPGVPSRGAVFADVNADTHPDLLLTTVGGGCRLFLNRGKGQFEAAPGNGGIRPEGGASSLALADVDGNGSLDLYVANNRTDDIRDYGRVHMRRVNGQLIPPDDLKDRLFVHQGQLHEFGEPDVFYLNDGKGTFTETSWTDGRFRVDGKPLAEAPRDWGLSVAFRDLNGDLAPDLYVCNDYWTPDRVWMNDGQGGFDELGSAKLGVTSSSSMGVDMADVNQDGYLDLLIVDMLSRHPNLRKRQQPAFNPLFEDPSISGARKQVMHNTLLMQQADGSYIETAFAAGLPASDWAWCPIFMDVDLDGDADLLVSSGYPHDVQDLDAIQQIAKLQHSWERFKDPVALRKAFAKELMQHYRLYPKLDMPLIAFENQGNGTFVEKTQDWGTHHPGVHQGFATGDLDGDGDQDLVVNNLNAPVSLYQNNATAPRIQVRLIGTGANTQAIGAKLVLKSPSMPDQQQEIIAGGRYVSGCDTAVTFAVPAVGNDGRLDIHWRDGSVTEVSEVRANHAYLIRKSDTASKPGKDQVATSQSLLELQGNPLPPKNTVHRQPDPSMRQPLLPLQIDPVGGKLVFADSDQDGSLEIVIGGDRGSPLQRFEHAPGAFWKPQASSSPLEANTSGMLELAPGRWLVSFRDKPSGADGTLRWFEQEQGAFSPAGLPSPETSTVLARGALNGQGALSVFLGGGAKPGHYPQFHPSMLYDVVGNTLRRDTKNGVLMESLGVVHDAVWSDLNQDGYPELLVAAAWSPVRVFENRRGDLFDVTGDWGFGKVKGYWLSITTGDVNGDGLLDVIAGNLGSNTPWQAAPDQPFKLVYGTFSNPNVTDLIETVYHEDGTLAPLRLIGEIGNFMPFFYQHIKDHRSYSEASIDTLLGNRKGLSRMVEAHSFSSVVYLNRGKKKFEAMELPMDTQWGAVTDLSTGDFDGDGRLDIAYVHNQLWSRPGLGTLFHPRAGILLGHPSGGWESSSSEIMGHHLIEPVEALKVGDVTLNGRADVMIQRPDGHWEQHVNRRGKAGLKINVKGPSGNPRAVGAQLRTFGADASMSAIHELRDDTSMPFKQGSQILIHASFKPAGVWVRWPGGGEQRFDIDPDLSECQIDWTSR